MNTSPRTLYVRRHFGFLWRALLLDGSTVVARCHGFQLAKTVGRGLDRNRALGGHVLRIDLAWPTKDEEDA